MQSRTVCVALIQGPAPWSNEPGGCPRGQGQMGSSWGNFLHSQFSSPLPNPQLQPLPRYFPHFSLPTHGPLSPVSLSFNRKAPSSFSCGTTMDQNQLLEFPHVANHRPPRAFAHAVPSTSACAEDLSHSFLPLFQSSVLPF